MNDNPMRDVFVDDIFTEEPPIGAVVTDALRQGRRVRRRHRATAIAGGLAGVAVIAVGLPMALGGLSAPGPARPAGPASLVAGAPGATATANPGPAPTAAAQAQKPPLPPGLTLPLPTPTVPAQNLTGDQVPITAKSVAQLLIDVMPTSVTHTSGYLANANDGGHATATLYAVSAAGKGTVAIDLRPKGSPTPSCDDYAGSDAVQIACQTFHPSAGTTVVEYADAAWIRHKWMYTYNVDVQRPDGIVTSIEVTNTDFMAIGVTRPTSGLPLTFDQAIAVTADPRWAWTAQRSFVDSAKHLALSGKIRG